MSGYNLPPGTTLADIDPPAAVKLTPQQEAYLLHGIDRWFEPSGRGWRTCDGLVKRGLMEHNGAGKGRGERYHTTKAGFDAVAGR